MDINPDNVIYTDYEITKNEINEYAKGWLYHFSNYIMPGMNNHKESIMGMIKYATRFITKTKMSYPKFKNLSKDMHKDNKFEPDEIDLVLDIYNKIIYDKKLDRSEYIYLNDFIYKYLDITGMGDVVREKEDPGSSFGRF